MRNNANSLNGFLAAFLMKKFERDVAGGNEMDPANLSNGVNFLRHN